MLEGYAWPGNVRELKNIVERLAILCDADYVEPRHVPSEINQAPPSSLLPRLPARWEEFKEYKRQARDALLHGELDGEKPRAGALDVLAQHVLGSAVAAPFDADALYAEVRTAAPYADLPRADFDRVLDYVATGGYALRAYERYAKLKQTVEGLWRVASPQVAQRYRLNCGTIVEVPMLKVRVVRIRPSPGSSRNITSPSETRS